MKEQERKYALSEVHTNIGTEGEIIFDQRFMEILDVQPGDWICFFIDEQGLVTVKGERKRNNDSRTAAVTGENPDLPRPDQITQTTLFSEEGAE